MSAGALGVSDVGKIGQPSYADSNWVGLDMPGVRGTTWAAYNAVTEWVDHHRPTRARHAAVRASRRLESSWFGSGAKLKAKAWSLAVEMALGL